MNDVMDISDIEAHLGFQAIKIEGLGPTRQKVKVVVKILGTSDIVLKSSVEGIGGCPYSHQRYGWMPADVEAIEKPSWNPVGMPYGDPRQAIFEAQILASEVGATKVKACPYFDDKV
jgi:hypothetical protein